MDFVKFEHVSIRDHLKLGEQWVENQIREDPSILGLGDVVVKDWQRMQPGAGRLDLLLQDPESARRYEVELQLGPTDPSHLIRTIEYWDIERKRYPQYEHTAVIVAEDITSRFLNVIGLFNGMIPLIAIQMRALRAGEKVGLVFTTVVDLLTLGPVDEDEEVQEPADRAYWETRVSKKIMGMADALLGMARQHEPSLELKYNKFYIGFAAGGRTCNFMILRPKKSFLRLDVRLQKAVGMQEKLESSGLDVMDYDARRRRYRLRLQPGEIEKHGEILTEIISAVYTEMEQQ